MGVYPGCWTDGCDSVNGYITHSGHIEKSCCKKGRSSNSHSLQTEIIKLDWTGVLNITSSRAVFFLSLWDCPLFFGQSRRAIQLINLLHLKRPHQQHLQTPSVLNASGVPLFRVSQRNEHTTTLFNPKPVLFLRFLHTRDNFPSLAN